MTRRCEFNTESCSPDCKKFSICQYYFVEKQISEIQNQLNFIYKTLTGMTGLTNNIIERLDKLSTEVVTKDSEKKNKQGRSQQNEKEN